MVNEINERVIPFAARVAKLALEFGDEDAGPRLAVELRRILNEAGKDQASSATVVVVGEKKRGKSSLINALLGFDGLVPVDVDVATSCYIAIEYGSEEGAIAFEDEHPDGIAIAIEQLAEYASVEGNRDEDEERPKHEGVTATRVFIESPILRAGITLIDTPGVGGLEAGHTDITLATLSRADALLFVLDPDSPIKASELRFLEQATDRIATVAFAMTKTDLYPGWQRILADDRELIARFAPRYSDCEWIPLSSPLKFDSELAAKKGDPDRARDLLQRSGFPRLQSFLMDEVAPRRAALQRINTLQLAMTTLERMKTRELVKVQTADGESTLAAQLKTEQASLVELTKSSAGWPRDLQRGIQRLDFELQNELARRLTDVQRTTDERVAAYDPGLLENLPQDLGDSLQGLWMDLVNEVGQGIAGIYASVAKEFSDEGVDALAADLPYPERLAAIPPIAQVASSADERGGLAKTLEEYGPVVGPVSVLSMLATQLGLVVAGPVLAIAGIAAGMMLRGRRKEEQNRVIGQRDARAYVSRMLSDARQEMTARLRSIFMDLQDRIEKRVTEVLSGRRQDLERTIAEHNAQLQLDGAARQQLRRSTGERLGEIDRLIAEALALRRRLEEATKTSSLAPVNDP
jgi:hypothetical protein